MMDNLKVGNVYKNVLIGKDNFKQIVEEESMEDLEMIFDDDEEDYYEE